MIKVIQTKNNITLNGHCREHDACMNLTGIINTYRMIYKTLGYENKINAAPGYLHISKIPEEKIYFSFIEMIKAFCKAYPENIIPF